MRPGMSAIEKTGKGTLRLVGSAITSRETTLEPLRFPLQPCVAAYTDSVLDAEQLTEFIEQWGGETNVSAQFDAGLGESAPALMRERFSYQP
jgi:hypothetical protein